MELSLTVPNSIVQPAHSQHLNTLISLWCREHHLAERLHCISLPLSFFHTLHSNRLMPLFMASTDCKAYTVAHAFCSSPCLSSASSCEDVSWVSQQYQATIEPLSNKSLPWRTLEPIHTKFFVLPSHAPRALRYYRHQSSPSSAWTWLLECVHECTKSFLPLSRRLLQPVQWFLWPASIIREHGTWLHVH